VTTRGECPGVHTPFLEADGALLRIRVPGGTLSAKGLLAAASFGGTLEITSRANLQLRGLDPNLASTVADALVTAGLTLPDPVRDERRNVLAGPTAGFDATELADVSDLVAAIEALLVASGSRSPKFGVLLDGGGTVSLRGRSHDICLGAVAIPDRPGVAFEVRLGGPLPSPGSTAGPTVVAPASRALAAVEAALALCPDGGRMADALAAHGSGHVLRSVAAACGGTVEEPPPPAASAAAPLGLHDSGPQASWAGTVWCGAAPALGRLSPGAARGLAAIATEFGPGEIRLTPWRGVILPGLDPASAADGVRALAGLGFSADPADPVHRVIACAGSSGCHSGLTDTQADAGRLVERLRASSEPVPSRSVHLSGCPKGCASRAQVDLTLVGGPEPGAYELYGRDPAAGGFGRLLATGLDPDAALIAVTYEDS
jgi:precorrin-3B synthase